MKITKKHILASLILTLVSAAIIMTSLPVQADNSLVNSQVGMKEIGTAFGNSTPADIRATLAQIINVVLGFLGVIFLILAVYAGFMYMTAAGNEEKTKSALDMLRNAIIGLVIVLAAWAITRFTVIVMSRTVNNAVDYRLYTPY
jgi:uncharacterized membrane protein